MSLYDNMATTALKQIADKGRMMQLSRMSDSTYNEQTDTFTPIVQQSSFKGLMTQYSLKERESSLIQASDKKLLIAAQGFEKPDKADKVLDDGETYSIVEINEIKPGPVAILYILQVRK